MSAIWKRFCFFLFGLFALGLSLLVYLTAADLLSSRPLWNDDFSLGYPIRILVSTAIQHGILPLWDHWTHGGFPLGIINSSYNVSPVVVLLGLFQIYTMKTCVFELIIFLVIGFIGMYFWCRRFVNPWISILGAFSTVLMGTGIIESPINSPFFTVAMLYPWIALGLSAALRGKAWGIGIISISLWILFTTGYVGTCLLALQFIGIFCFIECIPFYIKRKSWHSFFRGLVYVGIAGGLFLCLYSLPLFETWHFFHFDMKQIREAGANNPFAAAARLSTLSTLWYPNDVLSFIPDAFDGYNSLFYFGSLNLLFLLYAVISRWKKPLIWLLLLFTAVSYVSTLSVKYPIGTYFVRFMPFFADTRWHAANMSIPTFFAVTLACIGVSTFIGEKRRNLQILSIVLWVAGACIAIWIRSSEPYFFPIVFLFYPQTLIFLLFVLFYWMISFSFPSGDTRFSRAAAVLVSSAILLEISFVSLELRLFTDQYTYLPPLSLVKLEEMKTEGFPVPDNTRTDIDTHINIHYYDKKPTLYGYNPIVLPSIYSLMKQPEYPTLFTKFFYPSGYDGLPDDSQMIEVKLRALTTDRIEAQIQADKNQSMTLSMVYTPNWKATIDGKKLETSANAFHLIHFTVPAGTHILRFLYRPWYLRLSLGLMAVGLFASILSFLIPVLKLVRMRLKK